MQSSCIRSVLICFAFAAPPVASAQDSTRGLSPLQLALDQALQERVVPAKDREQPVRHYFRRQTLSFQPENLKDQIEAYEMREREGYENGPFYVYDATGKTGNDSAGQKWFKEVFTIEPDWAAGLKVPYFCRVLKLRDEQGQPVSASKLNEQQYLKLCQNTVKAILKPLLAAARDPKQAQQLQDVPMYVVKYVGNFEGNSKYVKLYVGKPGTADFLVFDVCVYERH